MKHRIFLIFLFALLSPPAVAEIYKWMDKDGKVHFSDKSPQDIKTERVEVKVTNPPENPDEGELRRRRNLEQADKDAQRTIELRKEKKEAETHKSQKQLAQVKQCLEARKQLAILQEQTPVYRDDQGKLRVKWKLDVYKGERAYLDDAMRKAEIEKVRQKISEVCPDENDAKQQEIAREIWVRSEYCAAYISELEMLERPESKTPREKLEEKRRQVDEYCRELLVEE